MKTYELLLKEHQLKVTPQRVGILNIIAHTGHISVEDLFESVRKTFSNISLSTLYKNINAMMEVSLLKEVKIPHAKSKFEIIKSEHSHVLCENCGKLEDIVLELQNVVQKAIDSSGYKLSENSFILSGICPQCLKLQNQEAKINNFLN